MIREWLRRRSRRVRVVASADEARRLARGWNDPLWIDAQAQRALQLAREARAGHVDANELRTLAMLSQFGVSVLDFGGGFGVHCETARRVLPMHWKRWCIVETSAVLNVLRQQPAAEGVSYAASIVEARRALRDVDVVYANGSLQYTAHPLDILRELTSIGAKAIMLTRFPLTEGDESRYGLQSAACDGLSAQLPITFCPRADVEAILSERYDIRLRIAEDHDVFFVDGEWIGYTGYICQRKRETP